MIRLLLFLSFSVFCLEINSQNKNTISGKINMNKKDSFITLRAQVTNEGVLYRDQLNYIFIALKQDENGNYSNNKQSGEFSLKPQEEKGLATIRVNIGKKEGLRAYLFIKQNDKLISKDSVILITENSNHKKSIKKIQKKEKDFFIKGIVLDEVITKIGKDFHDYFYQSYLLSGKKHPFIIKIKEKPGIARSSILSVEIEDFKVHQFFSKPDEEYLKQNVKLVLVRINNFAKRRKQLLKASKI